MGKPVKRQTREEMEHEREVLIQTFARAAELDKAKSLFDEMGWRGRLHVWLRWHVWHLTLRPIPAAFWSSVPRGDALKDIGVGVGIVGGLVGIVLGVITIVQKCSGP